MTATRRGRPAALLLALAVASSVVTAPVAVAAEPTPPSAGQAAGGGPGEGAAPVPAAAATPEGPPSSAELDALRARTDEVALDLTARTQAWEELTAQARKTRGAAQKKRLQAARAELRAEDARARLDEVIAEAYRGGNPTTADLILSGGELRESLAALGYLQALAGSRGEALRELQEQQAEIVVLQRDAKDLAAQAAEQEQRAADQVTALQAVADEARTELEAATAAYQAEQERLRRDEAERLAQEQGGAPGAAVVVPAGACAGASLAGYPNGLLDTSALCELRTSPGQQLRADAAAAYDAMSDAYAAEHGGQALCVTDSYRSYAAQVDVFRRKPSLAAVPGTSNHGWGVALDMCGGVQTFGSPAHTWMQQNAGRFGWTHPSWARQGGSKPEAWHWEFVG